MKRLGDPRPIGVALFPINTVRDACCRISKKFLLSENACSSEQIAVPTE